MASSVALLSSTAGGAGLRAIRCPQEIWKV